MLGKRERRNKNSEGERENKKYVSSKTDNTKIKHISNPEVASDFEKYFILLIIWKKIPSSNLGIFFLAVNDYFYPIRIKKNKSILKKKYKKVQ